MEHKKTCMLCTQDQNLLTLRYGKRTNAALPEHITHQAMEKQFARIEDFPICPHCIQSHGKSPRKAWTWYWGLTLLFYACLIATVLPSVRGSSNNQLTLLMIPFTLTYFTRIGFGMYLSMSSGLSYGKLILMLIAQFMPIWSEITLLCLRKRITKLLQAKSALKPLITTHFDTLRTQREALKQQIESGEITDQATIQALRQQESLEAAQTEQQQKAVTKGNIWQALAGFAITIVILLQGLDAYSGRGYMELFNSIRLSESQFYLLIAGLLIFDTASLVNALKKR